MAASARRREGGGGSRSRRRRAPRDIRAPSAASEIAERKRHRKEERPSGGGAAGQAAARAGHRRGSRAVGRRGRSASTSAPRGRAAFVQRRRRPSDRLDFRRPDVRRDARAARARASATTTTCRTGAHGCGVRAVAGRVARGLGRPLSTNRLVVAEHLRLRRLRAELRDDDRRRGVPRPGRGREPRVPGGVRRANSPAAGLLRRRAGKAMAISPGRISRFTSFEETVCARVPTAARTRAVLRQGHAPSSRRRSVPDGRVRRGSTRRRSGGGLCRRFLRARSAGSEAESLDDPGAPVFGLDAADVGTCQRSTWTCGTGARVGDGTRDGLNFALRSLVSSRSPRGAPPSPPPRRILALKGATRLGASGARHFLALASSSSCTRRPRSALVLLRTARQTRDAADRRRSARLARGARRQTRTHPFSRQDGLVPTTAPPPCSKSR